MSGRRAIAPSAGLGVAVSVPGFCERVVQLLDSYIVGFLLLVKTRTGKLGERSAVVALELLHIGEGERGIYAFSARRCGAGSARIFHQKNNLLPR